MSSLDAVRRFRARYFPQGVRRHEMFANHPTVIAMREEHTRERARMEREMEELLIELDKERARCPIPRG